MLRAIIFDFNGVILDDEPLHFASMRNAVAALGIPITKEEYWREYLPLDDERCLDAICKQHGRQPAADERQQVLARKREDYERMLNSRFLAFPGAVDFVRAAADRYPLAIASGARRKEITAALQALNIAGCFRVVVAAEDFHLGKPHPESFLLALERLNARLDSLGDRVRPGECLVIEDSIGGVAGARAAGMRCIGVSSSYPASLLREADRVVASLSELEPDHLATLIEVRQ